MAKKTTKNDDDIFLWPDGDNCFRSEYERLFSHKDNNYEVVSVKSLAYEAVYKSISGGWCECGYVRSAVSNDK